MDYFVRNATGEDVAAIIRLERESSTAAHWTDTQYESLFGADLSLPARMVLVASTEGRTAILGFLVARYVSREWELENIVVGTGNRGNGIGASLLTEMLVRAQTGPGDTVFLEVRESNSAAHALYAKFGFQQCGRRKSYYANPLEDAILYTKTLSKGSISD